MDRVFDCKNTGKEDIQYTVSVKWRKFMTISLGNTGSRNPFVILPSENFQKIYWEGENRSDKN